MAMRHQQRVVLGSVKVIDTMEGARVISCLQAELICYLRSGWYIDCLFCMRIMSTQQDLKQKAAA